MDSTAHASNTELRLGKYWKLLVCLLSFIAYLGTVRFDFLYDDAPLIIENPYISSWKYLPSYFGTHLFQAEPNLLVRYYRPLVITWRLIQRIALGLVATGTSDLQRAASLDPGEPEIHMMLGVVAEREGQLPAALDNYRRKLAAQPPNDLLRKHPRTRSEDWELLEERVA